MMFSTVYLHPVEERFSSNERGGCLTLVNIYLILHVV